jgi:hypothetical protein
VVCGGVEFPDLPMPCYEKARMDTVRIPARACIGSASSSTTDALKPSASFSSRYASNPRTEAELPDVISTSRRIVDQSSTLAPLIRAPG